MNNPFVSRVGGIMSADIAVPQHELVVRFYARVLTTGKKPFWREDLMNNRGMPVIGIGPRSAEYNDLPLQWMPHIQVADVAKSVETALELGATEILHGKNDDGVSQWAVLLDPNGAAFGLIPVVSKSDLPAQDDPALEGEPGLIGCISWLDLTTTNASNTRDFYQKVIGWSVQDVEMLDASERYADYNMLGDDNNPASGICHARGVNMDIPPVWMLYLPVADLAVSLRIVQEEGGKIIKQTMSDQGSYSYAVIQDPVGACVALVPG